MNQLDELNDPTMDEGRDVNVIAKRLKVDKTLSDVAMPVILVVVGLGLAVLGVLTKNYILLTGIALPIIVWFKMANAKKLFSQYEQKIQARASEIDNYMEQRVIILENLAGLVNKAINLDQTTFVELSKYRSGNFSETERNEAQSALSAANRSINVALEAYPELRAHNAIADAIQQNNYLQREITAARSAYNDAIFVWNKEIFEWPFKKLVAAKNGYTTRIPFIATKETKEKARGTFF